MTSYRSLLETLDAWFARGVDRAGKGVVPCKRTCSACCHGVFDISPADAHLLAEGLGALPPERASTLVAKAADQLDQCARLLPTWGKPWDVDRLPDEVLDGLAETLSGAPCPALDHDGGCAVYPYRPATCRMTGLTMDMGNAGQLDNECPIQGDFPDYAALAGEPFELMEFEDVAAAHDEFARRSGQVATTVAGAMVSNAAALKSPPGH